MSVVDEESFTERSYYSTGDDESQVIDDDDDDDDDDVHDAPDQFSKCSSGYGSWGGSPASSDSRSNSQSYNQSQSHRSQSSRSRPRSSSSSSRSGSKSYSSQSNTSRRPQSNRSRSTYSQQDSQRQNSFFSEKSASSRTDRSSYNSNIIIEENSIPEFDEETYDSRSRNNDSSKNESGRSTSNSRSNQAPKQDTNSSEVGSYSHRSSEVGSRGSFISESRQNQSLSERSYSSHTYHQDSSRKSFGDSRKSAEEESQNHESFAYDDESQSNSNEISDSQNMKSHLSERSGSPFSVASRRSNTFDSSQSRTTTDRSSVGSGNISKRSKSKSGDHDASSLHRNSVRSQRTSLSESRSTQRSTSDSQAYDEETISQQSSNDRSFTNRSHEERQLSEQPSSSDEFKDDGSGKRDRNSESDRSKSMWSHTSYSQRSGPSERKSSYSNGYDEESISQQTRENESFRKEYESESKVSEQPSSSRNSSRHRLNRGEPQIMKESDRSLIVNGVQTNNIRSASASVSPSRSVSTSKSSRSRGSYNQANLESSDNYDSQSLPFNSSRNSFENRSSRSSSQRDNNSRQETTSSQKWSAHSKSSIYNNGILDNPFADASEAASTFADVSLTDKSKASSFDDASFSTQGVDAGSKDTVDTNHKKKKKKAEETAISIGESEIKHNKEDANLRSMAGTTENEEIKRKVQHHKTEKMKVKSPEAKVKMDSSSEAKIKNLKDEEQSIENRNSDKSLTSSRRDSIAEQSPPKDVHATSGRTSSPIVEKTPRYRHSPSSHSESLQFEPEVKIQRCKSLAILGTMSDAGKSIMTAGICRILANHGVRVAPFKGQNMSNNAAPALLPDKARRKHLYATLQAAAGGPVPVLEDECLGTGYGEIGTAQSLQAEACRQVPRVEMNPVLLKSGGQNKKGEYLCSVLVLGKQIIRETYGDLGKRTTSLRTMVLESHSALAEATDCEVILMEGAGSCTELNLMDRDIVNLPLVRALHCPWLLVANIDCGGVFAQIVGTKMCVSKRDWSLCVGIIVNKLRGEAKYFEPGPAMIEEMVGKPVFVVPFLPNLHLPEEDGTGIDRRLAWERMGHVHPEDDKTRIEKKPLVVLVAYPHTAISDDICPLEADSRFCVQWRRRRIPKPYPHTTSVILPGSRLTKKDLKWLHDSGWALFLRKHAAAGGCILGICGGYQMLGWSVDDPHSVEGSIGSGKGLGLLPIRTTIDLPELKVVAPRQGILYPTGPVIQGFELHCGQSHIAMTIGEKLGDQIHPLLTFDDGKPEGMCLNRVRGTYVHGILWSPEARMRLLVPNKKEFPNILNISVEDPLNRLARHLEDCGLDFETLHTMIASHKNG